VYSIWLRTRWFRLILRRWPGLGICFNKASSGGRVAEISAGGVCPNFRARRSPEHGKRRKVRQPDDETVRYIPLTQGEVAIVDAEDYEELMKHKWQCNRIGRNAYACRFEKGKVILMHRVIMKTPEGMVVDHKDHNGLHNRKGNLRNCTPAENHYNAAPPRGKVPFKGVTYMKEKHKYLAQIRHKGRNHVLGEFDDAVEAALARDRKAYELQGEFAYLNFPPLPRREGRFVNLSGRAVLRSLARASLDVTRDP